MDLDPTLVSRAYDTFREKMQSVQAGVPRWEDLTPGVQQAWIEAITVAHDMGRVDEQFGEDS